MKKTLKIAAFILLIVGSSASCKNDDGKTVNNEYIICENKTIIKVLVDEPAYIRKQCFEHIGRVDAFFFVLANEHVNISGNSLFPSKDIPEQYKKEGLSVKISGNVTNCTETGGCIESNIRLVPIHIFEVKSIKIDQE